MRVRQHFRAFEIDQAAGKLADTRILDLCDDSRPITPVGLVKLFHARLIRCVWEAVIDTLFDIGRWVFVCKASCLSLTDPCLKIKIALNDFHPPPAFIRWNLKRFCA